MIAADNSFKFVRSIRIIVLFYGKCRMAEKKEAGIPIIQKDCFFRACFLNWRGLIAVALLKTLLK
jgi:hypothetical protein